MAFSADSQQFAVATTHGVFVFSQDATGGGIYGESRFVPQMLTKAVSAPAVLKALEEQNMSKAMILALALNDRDLLRKVYEQVPVDSIDLVVASIGSPLLPALIAFLGHECLGSSKMHARNQDEARKCPASRGKSSQTMF